MPKLAQLWALYVIAAISLVPLALGQCPGLRSNDGGMLQAASGVDVHWSKHELPLFVVVDTAVEDWEPEVKFGIGLWNNVVDGPIFVYGGVVDTAGWGEGSSGVIIVRRVGIDESPHVSVSSDNLTGALSSAPVGLPPDVIPEYRLRVVAHELGHVLGLAHDVELPWSVMYPYASGDGTINWSVTESDRRRLLEWYNPEKLKSESVDTATTSSCALDCHRILEYDKGTLIIYPMENK